MFGLFSSLFSLIGLAVTVGGMLVGFSLAREYVRNRLRYVDAVRNPIIPWVVAFAAAIVLMPVVAVLHIVHLATIGTAILIGGSTGFGTASGVKALKRGE